MYCSSSSGVELTLTDLKKFALISLRSTRIFDLDTNHASKEIAIMLDKPKLQRLIEDLQNLEKYIE